MKKIKTTSDQVLEGSGILDKVCLEDDGSESPGAVSSALHSYFARSTSSNISKWHHYFDIYEMLLAKFRNTANLQLLEIGVWKGGSLKMWRDYFSASATIVGVDTDDRCRQYEHANEKMFIRVGDQADSAFLQQLRDEFGCFDIIIDDGGHTTNQQITSFKHLYPALKLGGIYLVEDLHTNYWAEFQDRTDGLTFLDLAKDLTRHLYDPYRHQSGGYPFSANNPKKLSNIEVTNFYKETQSILFFDSIVAFVKAPRQFPRTAIR